MEVDITLSNTVTALASTAIPLTSDVDTDLESMQPVSTAAAGPIVAPTPHDNTGLNGFLSHASGTQGDLTGSTDRRTYSGETVAYGQKRRLGSNNRPTVTVPRGHRSAVTYPDPPSPLQIKLIVCGSFLALVSRKSSFTHVHLGCSTCLLHCMQRVSRHH